MSAINDVDAAIPLSEEEQELKTLLDRVMAGSTMQPLRDDLARSLPGIQSSLDESISILAAQKRLTQQAANSLDELKDFFESEFDAINRRFSDELILVSDKTTDKVIQECRKMRELLEISEGNTSATLRNVSEHMTAEFNRRFQVHQVECQHAIDAIENKLHAYAEQLDRKSLLVTQGLEGINQSVKELNVSTIDIVNRYRPVQLVMFILVLFNLCGVFYMAYIH